MGEAISLSAFIGNGKTVFFPGLVEKREHAVMKKIEKIAQRFITGAQAGKNEGRIEVRQRTLWARGPHKIYSERGAFPSGQSMD